MNLLRLVRGIVARLLGSGIVVLHCLLLLGELLVMLCLHRLLLSVTGALLLLHHLPLAHRGRRFRSLAERDAGQRCRSAKNGKKGQDSFQDAG